MSELKTYKFSDLYNMSSGISSKPEQAGHGTPFLSFSTVFNNYFLPEALPDLMDTSEKEKKVYSIKKGDIFLTRTSETLDELGMSSVALKDYPNASYSGFLKRLRPTQSNITYAKYMAFYLRSKLFRKTMSNNAIMTLRASLNEQIFSYIDLLLPEYEEQRKIGDLLFQLNTKIVLNNRINAELEEMAKLIYDCWFVQFDFPISAAQAQAMGKPELEGKPYKSSGGKMKYNEELKREIPEGWEVQPLMKFGDVITGKTPSVNNPEHFGNTLPFFTPVDFTGVQKIKITAERGISSAGELALKRYVIPKKSILITCIGSDMGKVSINYERGISNQQINSLKPFNPSHVDYLYQSISLIIPYLKVLGKSGSTVPIVNKSTLERINFINPPIDIVKSYNELTEPKNELIAVGLKQNQQLSSLRDWLLPMLMNGQVKVGEVAENLSMATEPEVNYGG